MTASAWILIIFFLRETYYDRRIPAAEQPPMGSRFAELVGLSQWKSRHLRNSLAQACWRTISVVLKPTVFLTCVYYALVSFMSRNCLLTMTNRVPLQTFAWAVGINTTLAIFLGPLYGFEVLQ
jgi:small-conductance mechanosensitive channel